MIFYQTKFPKSFSFHPAQTWTIKFPVDKNGLGIEPTYHFLQFCSFWFRVMNSALMPMNAPKLAQRHSPSSFFSLGTLLVASSIQFPSAECFSSRGLPTNTRSSRQGSSASFTNSATGTKNTSHIKMAGFTAVLLGLNSNITGGDYSRQFVI